MAQAQQQQDQVDATCLDLIDAIRCRRLLRLNCRMFSRLVEPHLLGFDEQGHLVLVCWQVSGGSSTHVTTGWKRFPLGEIIGLSPMDEQYAPGRMLDEQMMQDLRPLRY